MKIEIENDDAFRQLIAELKLAIRQLQQQVDHNGKTGCETLRQKLTEKHQQDTQ